MTLLPENQFIIERDDVNHPTLSGNKLHKLKPNITAALQQDFAGILSFGGPFSNHLHALAWACKDAGLRSVGVIRGELQPQLTPTLRDCQDWGMTLLSLSRKNYRAQLNKLQGPPAQDTHTLTAADLDAYLRAMVQNVINAHRSIESVVGPTNNTATDCDMDDPSLKQLMVLPEGGSNAAAIDSLARAYRPFFTRPEHQTLTHAVCATGTGATLAGLRLAAPRHINVIGIQAVAEGDATLARVKQWVGLTQGKVTITPGHLGGFGKRPKALIDFIKRFEHERKIPLDPVYNGKVMLQLSRMAAEGVFTPQDKVLIIHTGGLQGRRKNLN